MPGVRDNSSRQRDGDNMKSLRRIAWNGRSGTSALLCLATVALWADTSAIPRLWCAGSAASTFVVAASSHGEVAISVQKFRFNSREGRSIIRRARLQQIQASDAHT